MNVPAGSGRWSPLFPLLVPLLLYALARAAVLTWMRGGIVWRGTLYPLNELHQNRFR